MATEITAKKETPQYSRHDFGLFDEVVLGHGALLHHLHGDVDGAAPLAPADDAERAGAELHVQRQFPRLDLPLICRTERAEAGRQQGGSQEEARASAGRRLTAGEGPSGKRAGQVGRAIWSLHLAREAIPFTKPNDRLVCRRNVRRPEDITGQHVCTAYSER